MTDGLRHHLRPQPRGGARSGARTARSRRHSAQPAKSSPAMRISFQAACASASSSRWRSPAGRASSSPTSRPPRSTSPSRRRCSICCARMRDEMGLAMLYITHDLEVVADFCDRAIVMYAGDRVEEGLPEQCLTQPAPSLHARAGGGDPAHRRRPRRGSRRFPGQVPPDRLLAERLPLRAALRVRRRNLRGASGIRRRRALLAPAGGRRAMSETEDAAAGRATSPRLSARSPPCAASAWRCGAARLSASSARAAAANRRSRACCCASSSRPAAPCAFAAAI